MASKLPQGSVNDAVAVEMEKIREKAAQLGFLLKEILPGNSEIGAIVDQISGFASRALSTMDNCEIPQASRAPDAAVVGSPSSGDQRSDVVSSKRRKISPSGDRHGGFRRRSQPSSWKTVTTTSLEDGHTWRKYGQKIIQGAKHPRSYFRCTHRPDQGCKATKLVQKSEENPSIFEITYMGEHTCRDPAMVHQMLSATSYKDLCLISFETNNKGYNISSLPAPAETPLSAGKLMPSKLASTRQEYDEEVLSNLTTGSSSATDYDFVLPAAYQPVPVMPQEHIADLGDVTSSAVVDNFEMDFSDYQFELDNDFIFWQ